MRVCVYSCVHACVFLAIVGVCVYACMSFMLLLWLNVRVVSGKNNSGNKTSI